MSTQYGAIKTLMTMLAAAPSLANASVVFGEEMINAQDQPYPMVVVVPIGGNWQQAGYYQGGSTDINSSWMCTEGIDLYLGAESLDQAAQPVDHVDAAENFRAAVLQAFQNQAPTGLMFRPISGRWVLAQDTLGRRGRAYILHIEVDITIPDILPVDATVTTITYNSTI